jgi:ABC-type multidrug transport system fused ATPase/permease subunit
MAVDANRFFELLPEVHALWSGAFVIGMVTWLVYTRYLGAAVYAGLTVALLTFPVAIYVGTRLKALQTRQMEFKDERVKTINEVLNGMKVLKLYAWEPSFQKLIEGIRNTELSIMRRIATYNSSVFVLFHLAPFLVAMTSFITYTVFMGGVLTTEKVFVPLALFNILRIPMMFCE